MPMRSEQGVHVVKVEKLHLPKQSVPWSGVKDDPAVASGDWDLKITPLPLSQWRRQSRLKSEKLELPIAISRHGDLVSAISPTQTRRIVNGAKKIKVRIVLRHSKWELFRRKLTDLA